MLTACALFQGKLQKNKQQRRIEGPMKFQSKNGRFYPIAFVFLKAIKPEEEKQ
jgi:hypothetical protein